MTFASAEIAGPWINQEVVLFHGTDSGSAESIREGISLAACREATDFGRGFYTTTSAAQASDWARKRALRKRNDPIVLQFGVDRNRLAQLDALWFVRGSFDAEDFWSFVGHCRNGGPAHARSGTSAWYDVVAGPVANVALFRRSVIEGFDQVSFHSQDALGLLNLEDQFVATV